MAYPIRVIDAFCPGGPAQPDPYQLDLDHIRPLADGGSDDATNLQVLCKACHAEKTAAENTERAVARHA